MPNPNSLLSLLGAVPDIQQTADGNTPGVSTNATPIGPGMMPSMAVPPPLPPPPSLWQRIQSALMPDVPGANGVLSSDDMASARRRGLLDFGLSMLANSQGHGGGNAPGFGQALAGGVDAMRSGYSGSIDQTLNNRAQMQTLSQQHAILAGRRAIGQFLSQNLRGDQATDFAALRKAYMMSAAIGDTETMKALSPLLEKDPGISGTPLQAVSAGGQTVLLKPGTTEVAGVIPHTPSPIDPAVAEERQTRLQMLIAEAQARGDAREAQRLNVQLQHENTFMNSYRADPDIKYGTSVAQVAGQINALSARALQEDPFAQYQLIEAALRLRNPEMNRQPNPADYQALAKSVGLVGEGYKALAKFQQGAILPSYAIRRLLKSSYDLVAQGQQRYNAARQHYQSRLPAWNLDPALIPDAFESVKVPRPTVRQNPLFGSSENP